MSRGHKTPKEKTNSNSPPLLSLPFSRSALSPRGVQRCVWVSVCVCEPEPQEPCRTPGTSTRMPSSRASVLQSWISWRRSCRRWTPRYGKRLIFLKPARWSASGLQCHKASVVRSGAWGPQVLQVFVPLVLCIYVVQLVNWQRNKNLQDEGHQRRAVHSGPLYCNVFPSVSPRSD